MKTEIYHNPIENQSAIKELAGKLGLLKQVDKADNPIAIIEMTPIEVFAYTTLCPRHIAIEEFEDELIPHDCLEAYERAKSSGLFRKFEVWTIDKVKTDDPLIVGYAYNPGENRDHTWYDKRVLIARWGRELLPFDILLSDAKKVLQGHLKARKRAFDRWMEDFTDFAESDGQNINISGSDMSYLLGDNLGHAFPSIR